MPRVYTVSFSNVSVSAASDLFFVLGASNKTLRILGFTVSCPNVSLAVGQDVGLLGSVKTSASAGSGGTAPTPAKTDPGDAAATFTARVNDTSQSTGSATTNFAGGFHLFQGITYVYPAPPVVISGSAWVLANLAAPTGTVSLSGSVSVEEAG